MVNKIKNSFKIQDLETLTGIKAHTIRIWEKRYKILKPTRVNRNIRVYSLSELQKILNISLLQQHQYKISSIAKFSDRELSQKAKQISNINFPNNYHINCLIVSMFTLDEELFEQVYQEQIKTLSFEDIFVSTYVPLLSHIGTLWQTDSISPSHEHFVSNLIYQKIALNNAQITKKAKKSNRVHVLFLPEGELHEIGLFYLTYHLKLKGEKIIYLGRDIPLNNLFEINSQFNDIIWITSFSINITEKEKDIFIQTIEELLEHTKNSCWIIGKTWKEYPQSNTNNNIKFHEGVQGVMARN